MYRKGNIFLAKFTSAKENEQVIRPVLLLKGEGQNDEYIVMAIDSEIPEAISNEIAYSIDEKAPYFKDTGLSASSIISFNKLNTLNKIDILSYLGKIPEDIMINIETLFINYLLKDSHLNVEIELRKIISFLTEEFYRNAHSRKDFIKGKTYINYAGRVYDEKEMIALVNSSLDFWLTSGKYAQQFERELSKFLGVKYCLLTNSGSSANLLAVSALTSPKLGDDRLRPGDEVITTACGFPTTLNPIVQNNLTPIFIDIDLGTYNIQANKIEEAITEKTKAIIISHTLGNPAEIDKIIETAKKYDLWFIEDNCDALGSTYKGEYTGSFGHISTCSFYPAHHITMGEGGAVFTSDPLLKTIITSFRDWGRDCWCEPGCDNTCGKRFGRQMGSLPLGYDHKYIYSHIGYNLKVTDMQAAVGVEQLKKLPTFIESRRRNFSTLYKGLKQYEKLFILPQATKGSEPSWFGFPLIVKKDAPFKRREIINFLESQGIATRMLFGGNLTLQPAYKEIEFRKHDNLKNTDIVMNDLFWIGVYPGLTKEMNKYVIQRFDAFVELKRSGIISS